MTRLLLTALLALPLLVAGCGGEDESAGTQTAAGAPASTAAANGDQQQAFQEYQACLQEHGIELPGRPADGQAPPASEPDGGQPPQGTASQQLLQEAQQACGNPPGGGMGRGNQTPEQQQALQSCLQEHGVDVTQFGNGNGGPPPQSGQDGQDGPPGGPGGPGNQDPAVREAFTACQQELGLPGFGGPPPGSTTTG